VQSTVRSLRPWQAWFSHLVLGPTLLVLLVGCDRDAGPARGADRYARVTLVSDGDSLRLAGVGRVRLIGIDAPELGGECFGREAAAFAERVAPPGTRVRYRPGVERRDRYGRLLAYVWLPGGRMLNGLLVEEGYARPLSIAPNDDFAARFRSEARAARAARRGLWRACAADG
jgi:micrococcal nuclease